MTPEIAFPRPTAFAGDDRRTVPIGVLEVRGPSVDAAAIFEPALPDPSSPQFVKRRGRLQSGEEPASHAPLLELSRLNRSLGPAAGMLEDERLGGARFQPRVPFVGRFSRCLRQPEHERQALGSSQDMTRPVADKIVGEGTAPSLCRRRTRESVP